MAEIQIKNISKSFGDTKVLDKISFQVQDGHFLSLLGPSGCGKTTLLRIIAGLEYADEGAVLVGGADITQVPVEKRNIGVVFQNYALIPHMTVYNNIAYGLKLRKMDKKTIAQKVEEYIALVGLEGMENRKIPQLSGGQQQRVALARASLFSRPFCSWTSRCRRWTGKSGAKCSMKSEEFSKRPALQLFSLPTTRKKP